MAASRTVKRFYISIEEKEPADGYIYDGRGCKSYSDRHECLGERTAMCMHCQMKTTLAYLPLGNIFPNGKSSPFFDRTSVEFLRHRW